MSTKNLSSTCTDGWEYVFHSTASTSEENITMKFSNWLTTAGTGTIPVPYINASYTTLYGALSSS